MTSIRSLSVLSACAVVCLGWSAMVSAADCTTDADCAGLNICVEGRCVSPVTGKETPKETTGSAAACGTDADCTGQDICVQGRCVSPVAGKKVPKELPGFMGLFSAGPVFENSYGGLGFTASMVFGGSGSYFTMGFHLRAGARWEDSDAKIEPGVEFGYRFMKRLDSGMVPHFLVTIGYNHLIQFDEDYGTEYHWDIPVARIGGGIMWGSARRVKMGFEISYAGGHAFHANADENPWGEVYEWQYSAGHIHYLMTF